MHVIVHTPRGREAHFEVRDGTSDLAVVGSSYAGVAGSPLVDEYGLADLHVTGRFADVGAHIGSVGIAVLLDNPDATCVFVEPIPENVALLRVNIAANGLDDRAEIIEGAVGTNVITYLHSGSETLEANRYIGNLTVPPQRDRGHSIPVRSVTMHDLPDIAAMKVDCEGGEWGLFRDKAVTEVPVVFGEYHGGKGAAGVSRVFARTHTVTFTDAMATTGNFRAVAK